MNSNTINERNEDLYEKLDFYPIPPHVPISDIKNPGSFAKIEIIPATLPYYITRIVLKLSGFSSFYKTLPNSLEPILRKRNMRLPGLYAPLISATLSIPDDLNKKNQIKRAAALILASYDFYSDLKSGKLEPDRYKEHILEMGLYPNLFNTSVLIKNNKATLYKGNPNFTITIVIRRQFFILNLSNENKFMTYEEIQRTLEKIVEEAILNTRRNENYSIGLISAASNKTQFRSFKLLYKDRESRETIHLLAKSFLTVCLDLDTYPSDYSEATFLAHNTNHGNRWYHSATQIVVFGNAKTSIIFNFTAYIDGLTMARAAEEFYKRSLKISNNQTYKNKFNHDIYINYKKLNWKFPQKHLKNILIDIRRISDNQQATFELKGFGRNYFSKNNIDPISAFVTALYMAAKEFEGKVQSIHQFVSMSKYRCMSLLTVNVVTDELKSFIDIVKDPDLENSKKLELFIKVQESQKLAIRKARSELTIDKIFQLYMVSKNLLAKIALTFSISLLSVIFLRRLRLFSREKREILISHPSSSSSIPVMGRPGVRIPYVRYFGLHYQIMANKIVITMMPSPRWLVPNTEFISVLMRKLNLLSEIIDN